MGQAVIDTSVGFWEFWKGALMPYFGLEKGVRAARLFG